MSILHMRPDEVRGAADDLDYAVSELYLKPTKMRGMANSIVSNWESAKAQYYAGELRRLAGTLQREIITLQRLAKDARIEAAEWENADNTGAGLWSQIIIPPSIPVYPSDSAPESSSGEFNWWSWTVAVGGGGLSVGADLVGNLQSLTYINYQSVGRALNNLAGSRNAGWVGKMDDLGHFVKKNPFFNSPWFKYSGDAFYVGFGIFDDLKEGDSLGKALGSEALEFLVTKGATKGLTYLIPGAGQVMLVYEGVLLAGRVVAGGASILGYEEQAIQLQNGIDAIDLSTYTEKLTDGIFDYVEHKGKKRS